MVETVAPAAPARERAGSIRRPAQLPATTHLGPVTLAVTDAERALAVWRDQVGLTLIERTPEKLRLGAGGTVLVDLLPGAVRPVQNGHAGLYHVAIHVPSLRDLAVVIGRLVETGVRNSPTDHLVTECTYLWDADGNGIEITAETPWRGKMADVPQIGHFAVTADGRPHSGIEPLDLRMLFAELGRTADLAAPLPAGTRIGHMHLHVGDLDAAMRFYRDVIGFAGQMLHPAFRMGDVTLDYPPHIVAFNTWQGTNIRQAPEGSAGLRHFSVVVPEEAARQGVAARLAGAGIAFTDEAGALLTADPAGNKVRVVVG